VLARKSLLPLASKFAALPEEVKAKYVDEASFFSFGWSHGKEKLSHNTPDIFKGSYYANPLIDKPSCTTSQLAKYPYYFQENIWPKNEVPELEYEFKKLGKIICDTGLLLANHCDRYICQHLPTSTSFPPPNEATPYRGVREILHRSEIYKARLLHYFSAVELQKEVSSHSCTGNKLGNTNPVSQKKEVDSIESNTWCGWHYDHGLLTGLTAAMYLSQGKEVPNPDPKAGLYIKNRRGNVVQAFLPMDSIAFQVGEALQVASGGLFQATPHYVRSADGPEAASISRNTFAVFMQPSVDEIMVIPSGISSSSVAIGKWQKNMSFGDFSEKTFKSYYE